jgi:hypothetical protein
MVRFFSLVGLAVLVVAAVAVTTHPRAVAEEPQPANEGRGDDSRSRVLTRTPEILSFHAPFSLN